MEEQNNVQEQAKKKGGTVKLVLIVALIAALAGGAGMYFFMENKDKEEKAETKTENVVENNTVNEVTQNNVVEDINNTTNGGGFLSGLFGNGDENNTVNNTVENTVVNNTIDTNTTTNTVTDTNTTTEPSANTNNNVNANVKESSAEKPLALGEWGNASKYVSEYLSKEYKDVDSAPVPVSVTKITRGDEAAKILKAWCDKSTYYEYEDPKAKMEWVIVDYKVDLTGLTFDEDTIGTDRDIDSSVTGKGGKTIEHDGMRYYVITTDITPSEYAEKPGVYDGQFAVQLPVGYNDFVIEMGRDYNNGVVSYFKGQ